MKKILSITLALVMMLAICVPAFAAEEKQTLNTIPSQSGTVIVKTTTTTAGGDNAKRYNVNIPADTEIPWGNLETELAYSVESHLGDNEFVNVKVEGNGKMVYTASKTYELPYTLGDTVDFTATSPNVFPAAEQTFTVNVAEADWDTAVVGEYKDTLTFTATIV